MSRWSPALPKPVCFGPSIPPSVPSGNGAFLVGTTVTRVLPGKGFLSAWPWRVIRPRNQPSFSRSLIRSGPVIAPGRLCPPLRAGILRWYGYSLAFVRDRPTARLFEDINVVLRAEPSEFTSII